VGCVEKLITVSIQKPAICDELKDQDCNGDLVCVSEGTLRVCASDPCYTTACF
jgi:hypothetical protein